MSKRWSPATIATSVLRFLWKFREATGIKKTPFFANGMGIFLQRFDFSSHFSFGIAIREKWCVLRVVYGKQSANIPGA